MGNGVIKCVNLDYKDICYCICYDWFVFWKFFGDLCCFVKFLYVYCNKLFNCEYGLCRYILYFSCFVFFVCYDI